MGKKRTTSEEYPLRKEICEIQNQVEYLTEETIKKGLDEHKKVIKDWAYILHDRDKGADGKLKKPHWHIYLRFNTKQQFNTIASWFGIEVSYVCIIKTNFEKSCEYLIHRNDDTKFQYEPENVKSSFDYMQFLRERLKTEQNNLTETKKKVLQNQILKEVEEGTLRGYNFHEKYSYAERLEFRPYLDKCVNEIIKTKLFSNETRNLEVIYITGDSGTGKTSYAKEIAKRRNFAYAISAEDRDPLESYEGQPCIIIDEMRPSSMKLSNFLKLIDNNTESKAGARFHGKNLIECKLIIITSVLAIEDFFKNLHEAHKETVVQIKRRCGCYLVMDKTEIETFRWCKYDRKYHYTSKIKNPIPELYNIVELEEWELQYELGDILGLEPSEFNTL